AEMASESELKKHVNGKVDEMSTADNVSGTESKSKGKKNKEKPKMVNPLTMFRYADWLDKLLMALGTFLAALHGAALPLMMIIFGDMTDSFVNSGRPFPPPGERYPFLNN
ncbi:hypothetical protein JD844_003228, partial [Phrynosoma platyrhinos]